MLRWLSHICSQESPQNVQFLHPVVCFFKINSIQQGCLLNPSVLQGGWKKSCTERMIETYWKPIQNGILPTYQLAIRISQPSTVSLGTPPRWSQPKNPGKEPLAHLCAAGHRFVAGCLKDAAGFFPPNTTPLGNLEFILDLLVLRAHMGGIQFKEIGVIYIYISRNQNIYRSAPRWCPSVLSVGLFSPRPTILYNLGI